MRMLESSSIILELFSSGAFCLCLINKAMVILEKGSHSLETLQTPGNLCCCLLTLTVKRTLYGNLFSDVFRGLKCFLALFVYTCKFSEFLQCFGPRKSLFFFVTFQLFVLQKRSLSVRLFVIQNLSEGLVAICLVCSMMFLLNTNALYSYNFLRIVR